MTEPKKLRSIDFLSPKQLQRKRESDRNNARLAREQAKAYIQNLEFRVQQLEQQNYGLERKLANCECHKISYGAYSEMPQAKRKPPTDILASEDELQSMTLPNNDLTSVAHGNWSTQIFDLELLQILGLDNMDWMKCMTAPRSLNQPLVPSVDSISSASYEPLSSTVAGVEFSTGEPAWSTLPRHTPPVCSLDQVVADLIQSRRPYELTGGNIQEFQEHPFPSIPSLLNPTKEADRSPVTSCIVANIIQVMTVPTKHSNLPEQTAILYFMSSVIRWQISPTEANFNSMPEWLRPTPSQIAVAHPIWIDLIIWPKARERFCHNSHYHSQNPIITEISNESISINWPYGPSHMLMRDSDSGIILNPIFEAHIKNLNNWSLGPRILEAFPELVHEVNIGRPRGARG